jgi:hypothetical protein
MQGDFVLRQRGKFFVVVFRGATPFGFPHGYQRYETTCELTASMYSKGSQPVCRTRRSDVFCAHFGIVCVTVGLRRKRLTRYQKQALAVTSVLCCCYRFEQLCSLL